MNNESKSVNLVMVIILLSFLLFQLITLLSSGTGITSELQPMKYTKVIYDRIYSLNMKTDTKGAFIIGIGGVTTNNYYVFYLKDKDGDYKQQKMSVNDVVLRMTDSEEPKYIHEYQINKRHSSEFSKIVGTYWEDEEKINIKSILIVPTNTIKETYDVN